MKMFVAAVVGLFLAISGTSGKSVSSVPGCEPEVLLNCTKRLEYLNSDTALDLGASQQDLEKVCPTLQEGMQCINDYSSKCLPENIQVYFQSMYNGTISVISELCRPGDFQNEYLKHAPCMDKAKAEYKQCVDEYNGVMGRINPLEKEQRTTNIKVMCCSFSQYIECSNTLVLKRCGTDTAKFTEKLLDRLASPIIQEHCYRHFDGKKECDGIMTSLQDGHLPQHDRDHDGQALDAGHEDHDQLHHHKQQQQAEPKKSSPFDGAVGSPEPSSPAADGGNDNEIVVETAKSTNTATTTSSSAISTFLVTVFAPLALLYCLR